MRFLNYINETIIEKDSMNKFIENIKRDCKPFFNDIKGHKRFLYRGMKNADILGKKTVNKNRRPKDMEPEMHDYLDKLFLKYHGWKARSQGLFCENKGGIKFAHSSDFKSQYGTIYIVFPIGKYKYLWSQKINDLYTYINDTKIIDYMEYSYQMIFDREYLNSVINNIYYEEEDLEEKREETINMLKDDLEKDIKNLYTNKHIGRFLKIEEENEIMIDCKEYYYIKKDKETESELYHLLFR